FYNMAKDLTKEDKQRLLECASKVLNSMAEKRAKAQKEAKEIIAVFAAPFVEREAYYKELRKKGYI
ncbi:MAG: hypothetical protein K2H20_00680, partial [Bacilli bacterium]|nr:hypothetical protein [Bacilli bacterium]